MYTMFYPYMVKRQYTERESSLCAILHAKMQAITVQLPEAAMDV